MCRSLGDVSRRNTRASSTAVTRGVIDLIAYLWAHNRKRLAVSAIFGELSFIAFCLAGLVYRPLATTFVFVLPFFVARFFMMWGNWAQHVRFVVRRRRAGSWVQHVHLFFPPDLSPQSRRS